MGLDEQKADTGQYVVMAVAILLVFILFYFGGMVNDFDKFHEAATDYIQGDAQLYERYGYFYFPWAMILIIPLSLLGLQAGAAAFNTVSTAALVYSASAASNGSTRPLLISVLSPFALLVIYMSQWDTLTVAAAFIGLLAIQKKNAWLLGAALVVMATKPTHVWFPALLLMGAAFRWTWLERAKVLVLPAIIGALSFVFAGLDWPARYRQMLALEPPRSVNVSLAQIPGVEPAWLPVLIVGFPLAYWAFRAVRRKISTFDIVFALTANLLISVYVVEYHFVQTVPAIAWLAYRSPRAGVAAFVSSLFGFAIFWLYSGSIFNMAYVVVITLLLLAFGQNSED